MNKANYPQATAFQATSAADSRRRIRGLVVAHQRRKAATTTKPGRSPARGARDCNRTALRSVRGNAYVRPPPQLAVTHRASTGERTGVDTCSVVSRRRGLSGILGPLNRAKGGSRGSRRCTPPVRSPPRTGRSAARGSPDRDDALCVGHPAAPRSTWCGGKPHHPW